MKDYITPEEKIYNIALDKNKLDWKSFLYNLINEENIDPWDIDLSFLTKKYINKIKNLKEIDFEISGKLLTIAVFLLKTKVEKLIDVDLRGINEKINQIETEDFENEIEELSELDKQIDNIEEFENKKSYKLKYRNPIARKRKVNIFDLIKALEKTLDKSKRRKENILMKKRNVEYEGPKYHETKKNLKELIEDIYKTIIDEIENKKSHVKFSSLINGKSKKEIIETFLPILHLKNEEKINLKQEKHFGEIYITKN